MNNLKAENLTTNRSTKDKMMIDNHECIKVRAGLFKVVDKYVTSRSEFEQNESNQEIRLLASAEPYTDTVEVKYVVMKRCYNMALRDIMEQENLMIIYNDYWKLDRKYEYKIDLSKRLIIIDGKKYECIDENKNEIYTCVEYFGTPDIYGNYPMLHPGLPRHWDSRKEFSGLVAIISCQEINFREERSSDRPAIWYLCKNDNKYINSFIDKLNNNKYYKNIYFRARYGPTL